MQYMIARDWPLKGYFALLMLIAEVGVIYVWEPGWAILENWSDLFFFVVSVFAAPALAYYLGLLTAIPWVIPLYQFQAWRNGAPFQVGDQVRILVGQHRHREVRVYEVWRERNEVRVDLDTGTATTVKDVFSETQVCLVTPRKKTKPGK